MRSKKVTRVVRVDGEIAAAKADETRAAEEAARREADEAEQLTRSLAYHVALHEGRIALDDGGHVLSDHDLHLIIRRFGAPLDGAAGTVLPVETTEGAQLTPTCVYCGADCPVSFDGSAMRLTVGSRCPHPGRLPKYRVRLEVPSGRIAFANDMRAAFETYRDRYVNHAIECRRTTEDYAAEGLLHFIVGNSCPTVRKGPGGIFVGGSSSNGRRVGGVITDLWWVSAADHANLLDRCRKLGVDAPGDLDVVRVEPGLYEATVDHMALSWDGGSKPFAVIRRVGPCRAAPPPIRQAPEPLGVERTLDAMRLAYPSLYATRLDALLSLMDGSHVKWAHGGPLLESTAMVSAAEKLEAGAAAPPEGKGHGVTGCDTLSGYSAVENLPDDVLPEWLEAARFYLHALLDADPPRSPGMPRHLDSAKKRAAELLASFDERFGPEHEPKRR